MLTITGDRGKPNVPRDSMETHQLPFINDRPVSCNPPLPIHGIPEHHSPAQSGICHRYLRCQLCNGLRSTAYHQMHALDPIGYPSVGICSRRRTGCLGMTKEVIRSIHELPGN